jgi:broad-specificity NMP kinase
MNKLIIIRGPLGIGKTTIANKLASELHVECISIDEVLKDNGLEKDEDYVAEDFIKVNEIIIPRLKLLLKKQCVIVEGNFYFREVLKHLINNTPGNPIVFTLKAALQTCLDRDKERKNSHGPLATEAIYNIVNKFDYGITVDCEQNIENIIEKIKGRL